MIDLIARLPGLGPRSARRAALFLLKRQDALLRPMAEALADAAGFSIPPRTRCLVSEESEIGWHRPLTAEKLNPVLAFMVAKDSDHGIELAHSIAKFEGFRLWRAMADITNRGNAGSLS